jgi:hypothetical protein
LDGYNANWQGIAGARVLAVGSAIVVGCAVISDGACAVLLVLDDGVTTDASADGMSAVRQAGLEGEELSGINPAAKVRIPVNDWYGLLQDP